MLPAIRRPLKRQVPVITMPPGFDVQAFEISVLGLPRPRPVPAEFPWLLFGRATSAPAILSGYLPRQITAFKEVKLRTGPATLMEECSKREGENRQQVDRITLLWNVADRAYVLRGEREAPPSVQGWDLAAALTSAIEIANTIGCDCFSTTPKWPWNRQVRKIGWLVGGGKMAGYENISGLWLASRRAFLAPSGVRPDSAAAHPHGIRANKGGVNGAALWLSSRGVARSSIGGANAASAPQGTDGFAELLTVAGES
jgi:hypothetical protein